MSDVDPALEKTWKALLDREAQCGEKTVEMSFRPARTIDPSPGTATRRVLRSTPVKLGDDGEHDFLVEESIGEGGMGVILRATQSALDRKVALKRLKEQGDAARADFLAEAVITARLDHANIVPVHLLGQTGDESLLLAMKLILGTSWQQRIREGQDELDEHLRVFLAVCNAVAYAHDQGFLHRDIKPENVMIGPFGQVYLMDWGLAVGLDQALCSELGLPHVSAVDATAGTPRYMAPELARGEGPAQSVRTDVYLLGACLHEVLSGRAPHAGETVYRVLYSALQSAPPALDGAPEELAAACRRAMSRDPEQRQASVAELIEDVGAYLEHRDAHALIERGNEQLEQLEGLLARWKEGHESTVDIHRMHAEVGFAFDHAAKTWADAPGIAQGVRRLVAGMSEHADRAGDAALASLLLPHADEEQRARLEALIERLRGERQELKGLRREAERRDWQIVARPLGTLFIAGGLASGVLGILSRYFVDHHPIYATLGIWTGWSLVSLIIGAMALVILQRTRVPDSLVSERMFGTWFSIVVCIIAAGAISAWRDRPVMADTCYVSFFFGAGFAAMAFQTHRGLLVPAAVCVLGGVWMGVQPQWAPELLGGIWLVVLAGVGLFLRRQRA